MKKKLSLLVGLLSGAFLIVLLGASPDITKDGLGKTDAFDNLDGGDISIAGDLTIKGMAMYADTNQQQFVLAPKVEAGYQVVFTQYDNKDLDHGHPPSGTGNVGVFIHSGVSPLVDTTQWIGFQHDQYNGRIMTGVGYLELAPSSNVVKFPSVTSDPCGGSIYRKGGFFYNETAQVPCYCSNTGIDLKFSDNSACF